MDCSLPVFSVHGIFQARVLEWVAIAFSKTLGFPKYLTDLCDLREVLSFQSKGEVKMNSELAWIQTAEIRGWIISKCGRPWLAYEGVSQHPTRLDILFLTDFSGSSHGVKADFESLVPWPHRLWEAARYAKSMAQRYRQRARAECWQCLWLAVWPGIKYTASQSLSLPFCEMGRRMPA